MNYTDEQIAQIRLAKERMLNTQERCCKISASFPLVGAGIMAVGMPPILPCCGGGKGRGWRDRLLSPLMAY